MSDGARRFIRGCELAASVIRQIVPGFDGDAAVVRLANDSQVEGLRGLRGFDLTDVEQDAVSAAYQDVNNARLEYGARRKVLQAEIDASAAASDASSAWPAIVRAMSA